jgi:hypothetical protein
MVVALVLLVRAEGIAGAALAHAVLFIPFALAYLVWGTRFLQTSARTFLSRRWRSGYR